MRIADEREFTTHDATQLFYRYWPATRGNADRAIVLFHRGHEHSGRLQHIVDELDLPGFAMFAWDARGHGRSPGTRGDSPGFAASVKDVDVFVRSIASEYGIRIENIAVVAQSVGAVLAATWAHDYAPKVRCLEEHLEKAIASAVTRLRAHGYPLRIADIAAGHGRYVLEAMEKLEVRPESVLLRDYSDLNVRNGTALISEKNLTDIAKFVKADAFDEASVASIEPRPTIAIVSGLYELFPDNARVAISLRGLAKCVEPGGFLIYTGQPWHPQLELIARTLTSHRGGKPWIMRRRTQAELDELVERAGFSKIEQWTDEWGIFTVSLGVRA